MDTLLNQTLGDFLLFLYHRKLLSADENWSISKKCIIDEFNKYINDNERSNNLVLSEDFKNLCENGKILKFENWTNSTSKLNVVINSDKLLTYRKSKINKYIADLSNYDLDAASDGEHKIVFEVNEYVPAIDLVYRGKRICGRIPFPKPINECYICQKNFKNLDSFRDHVNFHSGEKNFMGLMHFKESNNKPSSRQADLRLSYKLCTKTLNYRFTIETIVPNVNVHIEKMILILSDIMYYIDNRKVPFVLQPHTKHTFDLNRFLFNKFVEQAIVVLYYKETDVNQRCMEQHHYMPCEKIPKSLINNSVDIYLPKLADEIFKKTIQLDLYMPSEAFRNAIDNNKKNRIKNLKALSPAFKDYWEHDKLLTPKNYCEVLKFLVAVEDYSTLQSYVKLEQRNVNLLPGSVFTWRIQGCVDDLLAPLDEVCIMEDKNQKSTKSDKWRVMQTEATDISEANYAQRNEPIIYVGVVVKFIKGRVIFRCNGFQPKPNARYTLLFRPIRYIIRFQYRALDLLSRMNNDLLKKFFFPNVLDTNSKCDGIDQLSNALEKMQLCTDPEQMEAVARIVNGNAGDSAPYIIYGPPGSGKTRTIVTAIIQLMQKNSNNRVLIMAKSNFACDEFAVRLINALKNPSRDKKLILRLYARSFRDQINEADAFLLNYSNMQNDHFFPSVRVIHQYRIVICTLGVAAKLSLGGFGIDAFTHLFVDEAPSATEPEALMGIMCALNSKTKLILCGDNLQLGTQLNSQRAEYYGLGDSMMVRLLRLDCYKMKEDGTYNPNLMIRLKRNYRAHPEIVQIYNELFYNNELIPCAPYDEVSMGTKWHKLPNPNFPIIFHNVHGEAKKSFSRSLYNLHEVNVLLEYISELLLFGINGKPIDQSDIGIITPYKEQKSRIKEEMFYRKWYGIKCGVAENFQGMEKQIILVSFVCTTSLGFLKRFQRINTIISRAKSLLILIGDSRCLSKSNHFKHIIEKCEVYNALIGEKYVPIVVPQKQAKVGDDK